MDAQTTYNELRQREFGILKEAIQTRGSLSELEDMEMNDITRQLIVAYDRLHQDSKCYLGKVNRYSEDEGKPYLALYEGQQVFNFEYGFMIPCYDEKLIELIRDREHAEYTGTKEDYKRVTEIMDRIQELGGINLFWV